MKTLRPLIPSILIGMVLLTGFAPRAAAVDQGITVLPVTLYDPSTGTTSNFFPVGWYWWFNMPPENPMASLDEMAAAGSNTVLLADVGLGALPVSEVRGILDHAQQLDLKVVVGLARELMDNMDHTNPASYHGLLANTVNSLKDHPALLGWQLGDENDNYSFLDVDEVTSSAIVVRSLDPNRQVWQVFGGRASTTSKAQYMGGCQVVSSDCYTIHDDTPEFGGSRSYLNNMHGFTQLAAADGWSYVNVTQGLGPDTFELTSFRLPTYGEYRWNVFASLASAGARGVMNWTYRYHDWYTDPALFTNFRDNTVAPVMEELNQIAHAMETGWQVGEVDIEWSYQPLFWFLFNNFDPTSQLLLYDDLTDNYYLVVTNNTSSSQNICVTLENLPVELLGLTVSVPQSGRILSLTDLGQGRYELYDTLGNYEVVIYSLAVVPEPMTLVLLIGGGLVGLIRRR